MTAIENAIENYESNFNERGGLAEELYKWRIITHLSANLTLMPTIFMMKYRSCSSRISFMARR